MKRLTISTLLVILNSLSLYSFSGAGSGTESDPYQITNVQQLQEMDDDLSAHYILMNDIDASDTKNWNVGDHDDDAFTPDSAMGFDPIGFGFNGVGTPFIGSFDGQQYNINNLFMNRQKNVNAGLFSLVNCWEVNSIIEPFVKYHYSEISNFNLYNIKIIGGLNAGSVIGECSNTIIRNIKVTGYIEGFGGVGGLIGRNDGVITNCHTNIEVVGNHFLGGLVGLNNGIILNSSTQGKVIAIEVPLYSYQLFSNIGGVAGINGGYIINSNSHCDVDGEESIGGLVGKNKEGFIYTCYSTGEVAGTESIGGLVGGNEEGFIEGCFWDTETSKQAESAGGTGLTTNSMKDINTYIEAGWNFDFIWSIDSDYPEIDIDFAKQPLDTDNNGYLDIDDAVAFRWFSESGCCLEQNIELTSNIDLTESMNWNAGLGFMPVGSYTLPFTGRINGNGFTINNLYIDRPNQEYVGMIACMEYGVIENLGLENCEVYGLKYVGSLAGSVTFCAVRNIFSSGIIAGDDYISGLIGRTTFASINQSNVDINVSAKLGSAGGIVSLAINSSICNSFSKGIVSGFDCVGGIAGNNSRNKILNSHSSCNVKGTECVGGIAGCMVYNVSYVINAYSTGKIEGDIFVGGIAGYNKFGIIRNSYSVSQVSGNDSTGGIAGYNHGNVESCFWDKNLSGISKSDGGEGKFSDEMKQKSMYTDAGWNFDFIWKCDDDYPYIDIDTTHRLTDSDGDGYLEISTVDDLRWLSESAIDIENNLEITNDIDAADTKNWNQGRGFLPIIYFYSQLNGNNYKISNLYINRPDQGYIGIFAQIIGENSLIKDIIIEDCNIIGDSCIGAIAGDFIKGDIINSCVYGNIKGNSIIGGLSGANYLVDFQNCNSEVTIEGKNYLGGIMGKHFVGHVDKSNSTCTVGGSSNKIGGISGNSINVIITNTHVISEITGVEEVGGLIGASDTDTIYQCSSYGKVSGESYIGGFIGSSNFELIDQVFASGQVTGKFRIGGLFGALGSSQLTNSFSLCNVEAEDQVAGLAGYSSGNIINSYSVGLVVGEYNSGALIGKGSKTILASFWDTETSGIDSSDGGTGKTTAEMKTKSTFTDADWDFNTIWAISPDINDGYPYFQWMEDIVGVEELPNTEIRLINAYPNPADNFLHISFPLGLSDKLNVRISDAAGNLVRDMDVVNINNELTVPVDGLSAGAYYMNIISGGEVYSVRFVVE